MIGNGPPLATGRDPEPVPEPASVGYQTIVRRLRSAAPGYVPFAGVDRDVSTKVNSRVAEPYGPFAVSSASVAARPPPPAGSPHPAAAQPRMIVPRKTIIVRRMRSLFAA